MSRITPAGALSWISQMTNGRSPLIKEPRHRRLQEWTRDGTMEKILMALARELIERGGIDIEESFIDVSFRRIRKRKIKMIAPHRRGRKKTQDGRELQRYKRRWKVERLFA